MDRQDAVRDFLSDAEQVRVPYKQNRMVIFNSNLFHESQTPRFRPGYTNRRINLTLLFGHRCGEEVKTLWARFIVWVTRTILSPYTV
jgi:hypothetical protein